MIQKAMPALVPLSLILNYGLLVAPLWVFLTAAPAIVQLADWARHGAGGERCGLSRRQHDQQFVRERARAALGADGKV